MHAVLLAFALLQSTSPTDANRPLTPPALRERLAHDIAAKDLDDLMTLYAPGAQVTGPDEPTARGATDIRKMFAGIFDQADVRLSLGTPAHREEGEPRHTEAITETGTYSAAVRVRATGEDHEQCGRFRFRYTRGEQTGWRIARMEWTATSCPAAAQSQ